MLVALIAKDKDNSLDVRMNNRPDHVAYLKSSSIVSQAGPLLNDAGDMIGSLVILEVDTMEQAQDWAAQDPYAKAGLFQSVDLIPWNKVI